MKKINRSLFLQNYSKFDEYINRPINEDDYKLGLKLLKKYKDKIIFHDEIKDEKIKKLSKGSCAYVPNNLSIPEEVRGKIILPDKENFSGIALAHELGHASGFTGNRGKSVKAIQISSKYSKLLEIPVVFGLPIAVTAFGKKLSLKTRIGLSAGLTGLVHTPTLVSEIDASIQALKMAKEYDPNYEKNKLKYIKKLGYAFGTYGLMAAIGTIVSGGHAYTGDKMLRSLV